jgi:hypothetical protein
MIAPSFGAAVGVPLLQVRTAVLDSAHERSDPLPLGRYGLPLSFHSSLAPAQCELAIEASALMLRCRFIERLPMRSGFRRYLAAPAVALIDHRASFGILRLHAINRFAGGFQSRAGA